MNKAPGGGLSFTNPPFPSPAVKCGGASFEMGQPKGVGEGNVRHPSLCAISATTMRREAGGGRREASHSLASHAGIPRHLAEDKRRPLQRAKRTDGVKGAAKDKPLGLFLLLLMCKGVRGSQPPLRQKQRTKIKRRAGKREQALIHARNYLTEMMGGNGDEDEDEEAPSGTRSHRAGLAPAKRGRLTEAATH